MTAPSGDAGPEPVSPQPQPFPPPFPQPQQPFPQPPFAAPYPPQFFVPPPRRQIHPDAVWYVLPGFGVMVTAALEMWAAMLGLFTRIQDRAADFATFGDGNHVPVPRHTHDATVSVLAWSGAAVGLLSLAGFVGLTVARSRDKKRA